MTYWMGIDGGGSTLRIVITDDDLAVIAHTSGGTANPSVIGQDAAAAHIRNSVIQTLTQANLAASDLAGVGVGIAGASAAHSEVWLTGMMSVIAPGVPVIASSDLEIALVGANNKREGVLVLAGTGSAAFGVNEAGESVQVGGWGFLLGDEGSSYWMGMKALKVVTRAADGREPVTGDFATRLIRALGLTTPADLIPWLYHSEQPRTREIAGLATVVIQAAAEGHEVASQIVHSAAHELALLCRIVIEELDVRHSRIAFSGGLLDNDNALSLQLCKLLTLESRPVSKHPPVIGAARLAQLQVKG